MRKKLFTFLLAIVASIGTVFASNTQIDGIWYEFDNSTQTPKVTYRGSSYDSYSNEYVGSVVIPSSVLYYGSAYRVTRIGSSAFSGCTGLTSITIPNSITSIEYDAFSGCSGLTSVHISDIAAWCAISFGSTNANPLYDAHNLYLNEELQTELVIPSSVTSIGSDAFTHCRCLTSMTIPNSVTSIGRYAFDHCSGLTSVTIPNSVTNIGEGAFSGCSGLTSVTIGESVTKIEESAFSNCSSLTSVTIPNSVTSIGKSAFEYCSSLTSVTIPNSVTSIGNDAFEGCSSLASVTIPNSVTSIGEYAFSGCSGLTSVTIPNSVTNIGEGAFSNCSGLTSIDVIADNTNYSSVEGVIFNKDQTSLIQYPGDKQGAYIIPNTVTSIESGAFSGCTGLTSVTIPNSVTSIGDWAFSGCTGLTSIEIPHSVTSIGSDAFRGCSGLTSIEIPNSVTSIENYAFYNCRSLTSVTINSNEIVSKNYSNSSNISKIFGSKVTEYIIGDSVISIGDYAFSNCNGLISVAIPNSITNIGRSAFSGCNITSVTIPNSVTNIGHSAFEGCRSLTSVEILSSVTNVGIRAFANCPLEKVYWGVADQADYAKEEFSSVGIKVGLDASNLNWSSVYLYAWTNSGTTISSAWPGTKVNIDESGLYTYTFSSSYSTINIIWNNGTDQTMDITNVSTSGIYTLTSSSGTNISYNTRPFEGKSLSPFVNSTANISEFTIGENVTRIPALLCEGAGNLTELTIPNSVTAIGESAFDGCSALTTLTLGENITSYGTNAFAGCSNLASIYNYRERPAKLGTGTFDGVDYFNCTLYVLAGSVNMYKSSGSDWKDFYFVEPIGATSTTTDEVVVTPHDNTADIVWPTISGAASYELEIKDLDGNLICTLIFNANGQLTSLAFHAPAHNNAPQQAQTAGFKFTVTGLTSGTRYGYTIAAKDALEQTVDAKSGTFTTTIEGVTTDIDQVIVPNSDQITNDPLQTTTKLLRNDQILILRGNRTYTLTGAEVK